MISSGQSPSGNAENVNSPLVFEDVDPSLVDNSAIDQVINGANLSRYSVVIVNSDYLWTKLRGEGVHENITYRLFPDVVIVGEPRIAEEHHEGERAGFGKWGGKIDGETRTVIAMVVAPDGRLELSISRPDGFYHVEALSQAPYHIIKEQAFEEQDLE